MLTVLSALYGARVARKKKRSGRSDRRRTLKVDLYTEVVMAGGPQGGVLVTPASEVTKFDARLREAAKRMKWLVGRDRNSLGLAAPQINVGKRIIALRIDGRVVVVVNPQVEPVVSAPVVSEYEGCFSLPLKRVRVARAGAVRLSGLDEHGEPLGPILLAGRIAAGAQHECDHLDGVLISHRGTVEDVQPGALISTGFRPGHEPGESEAAILTRLDRETRRSLG